LIILTKDRRKPAKRIIKILSPGSTFYRGVWAQTNVSSLYDIVLTNGRVIQTRRGSKHRNQRWQDCGSLNGSAAKYLWDNENKKCLLNLEGNLKGRNEGGDEMSRYEKTQETVKEAMEKFKKGKLKSGRSGRKVTSREQAVAIGLSEARKKGAKVPPVSKKAR
jgi:hypothetical protein